MPQLTDRFGPIQQQVILDGSGNGQVTFQPNGSNARITNLFVKVATSNSQAQCLMYKGQVADSTLIQNTNSGSTGAAAQGSIDLMDGEILYVVWRGGDPGAQATATFIGNTIPFDQIGSSNITWSNPLAAGDGSIVYPQFKSPDFQTGVSGWILRRDGSVEFSNAVIRGTLIAGGGTVTVNASGVTVQDISGNVTYLVNRTGGFVARNNPDNGAHTQMYVAGLAITLPTATTHGYSSTFGRFDISEYVNGTEDFFQSNMVTAAVNGGDDANVLVRSEGSAGTRPYMQLDTTSTGVIDLTAGEVNVQGNNLIDTRDHQYLRGENQRFLMSFSSATSGQVNINFTHSFSQAPIMHTNIDVAPASTSQWSSRAINITASGFTFFVYGPPGGAAQTWNNVSCSWTATEPTP